MISIIRRISASVHVALILSVLAVASRASAANPPGTGKPNQSCQSLEPNTPGNAANSLGSPFNEPGINSINGGVGGQHYSPTSQYDVACFQVSHR
ncbi:hypothetical protein [Arthrobacter sp. 2MCAF14]|uniref:hypothetical protein n=1 Tax=Arthrobacter sp. 2MCAF14 TaxID=3232982 RepID=UPI003F925071